MRYCITGAAGFIGSHLRGSVERGRPRRARNQYARQHHVVYADVVGRTQIYLGPDELALLDAAAARTGASRSELIRRAVQRTFGASDTAAKLAALEASAGSWKRRGRSGDAYVDAMRGDMNARLRKLGLE